MKNSGYIEEIAAQIARGDAEDLEQTQLPEDESDEAFRNLKAIAKISRLHRGGWNRAGNNPVATPGSPEESAFESETPPLEALDELELTDKYWGHLRIIRKIGAGSFGEVFVAHDPNLQKECALKLFGTDASESRRESLIHEARCLARVDHPNVVTVHGAEEHDGRIGIWCDLVAGQTLDEISRSGRMSPEEAAVIGREICRALAAVHKEGLIHQDVKPANIMRRHDGRYILLDFSSASSGDGMSQPYAWTARFAAPELFSGQKPSVQSDIYSLGVVLFRLVTGTFPVNASTLEQLEDAHLTGSRDRLLDHAPDLPQWFVDAVETALHPEPDERQRSIGEFEAALREPSREPATTAPGSSTAKRSPWVYAVAAVVAAALALVVTRFFSPDVTSAELFRGPQDGPFELAPPGSSLQPGDFLKLKLQSSRTLYFYVFSEDSKGQVSLLFPNDAFEIQNPVTAEDAVHLPGEVNGEEMAWGPIQSGGGREWIHILGSSSALDAILEYFDDPETEFGVGTLRKEDLVPLMRGISGFGPTGKSAEGDLADVFDEAASAREDLWKWSIELYNP